MNKDNNCIYIIYNSCHKEYYTARSPNRWTNDIRLAKVYKKLYHAKLAMLSKMNRSVQDMDKMSQAEIHKSDVQYKPYLCAPDRWCELLSVQVHDADGWRDCPGLGARDYSEKITEEEFRQRIPYSSKNWQNTNKDTS